MQINFTGHGIDVTDPMKSAVEQKFARLARHYTAQTMRIDVTFDKENNIESLIKARIVIPGGEINASETHEDMYAAIDSLVDNLDKQLIKFKEKHQSHH